MENVDMKILHELSKDSRQSFRGIAKKVGVATATVINKYNNMEKKGIIKQPTISVDHEKLGYTLTALIEVFVSKGRLVDVEKHIAKKPGVYGVYDITGDMDIVVLARFKSREDLNAFVKSILAMKYVQRTNTHLVLNVVKEDFSLGM